MRRENNYGEYGGELEIGEIDTCFYLPDCHFGIVRKELFQAQAFALKMAEVITSMSNPYTIPSAIVQTNIAVICI
jgi:hypothetical protein